MVNHYKPHGKTMVNHYKPHQPWVFLPFDDPCCSSLLAPTSSPGVRQNNLAAAEVAGRRKEVEPTMVG